MLVSQATFQSKHYSLFPFFKRLCSHLPSDSDPPSVFWNQPVPPADVTVAQPICTHNHLRWTFLTTEDSITQSLSNFSFVLLRFPYQGHSIWQITDIQWLYWFTPGIHNKLSSTSPNPCKPEYPCWGLRQQWLKTRHFPHESADRVSLTVECWA